MAHPEVFDRHGVSFSVSTDGTWRQLDRELSGAPAGFSRDRFVRRAAVEGEIFRRAEFVSCTSEWAAESVRSDYGISSDRVHVDPFPIVDVERPSRATDAGWLTFIGNDFVRKNGLKLLAWHQRFFADDVPLHIVSSAPVDRLIGREVKNVVVHGPVSNQEIAATILPQTRALVLPTGFDQSPLVLTEAAAGGVPAIASNIAGIPELVRDGESGFVCDPTDEAAFCDAIATLVRDDDLNHQMGEAARSRYDNQLRSDVITRRLIERLALQVGCAEPFPVAA